MKEKNGFSQFVEKFVGGKGFYIVLFACLAVVGISAWSLIFAETMVDPNGEDYAPVMGQGDMDDIQQVIEPLPEDDLQSVIDSLPAVKPDIPEKKPDTTEKPEAQKPAEPEPQQQPEKEPEPQKPAEAEPEEPAVQNEPLTFIWPVAGQVEVGHSPETLVFDKTMGDWRVHKGVDIAAQIGTKVMAAASGTVKAVEEDDMYGTVVYIDHGDGLMSVYANLAKTPTVKAGDAVTMGSVIGSVGDTALAEQGLVAHLHFEMMKDDSTADPADYLPRR